jgi:SPX domain protein involved in polyphosphate accumulation
MSSLNQDIRKFNRFELKYLINLKQKELIWHALGAYLVSDEHGSSKGGYYLTSLYYDSPDYRCYWEKVDGIRFRRKLRIRRYEDGSPLTNATLVFVEVKQRIDRVTQKRRVLLPYSQACKLCNNRQIPKHDPCDKDIVEEIYAFTWEYNLEPTSIVRYQRQALVGTDYDVGLRVTFDTNLTYQLNPPELQDNHVGLQLLPPNCVVMEIKVNERIPYWLTELVAAFNLNMVRMSKYCHSIEVANQSYAVPSPFRYASITTQF